MTKQEFIDAVLKAAKTEVSKKDGTAIVEAVFDTAIAAIKGKDKRFAYPGFGTFTVRERKKREGRNPKTGEKIAIPASKSIGFKPAASLKAEMNPKKKAK